MHAYIHTMTYLKSKVSKSKAAQAPHKPLGASGLMRVQGNKPAQAPGGHLGSCGRENVHSNLIPSSNEF